MSKSCWKRHKKQVLRVIIGVLLFVLVVQQLSPVLQVHIQVTVDEEGDGGLEVEFGPGGDAKSEQPEREEEEETEEPEEDVEKEAEEEPPVSKRERGRRRGDDRDAGGSDGLPQKGERPHKPAPRSGSGDAPRGEQAPPRLGEPTVGVVHLLFTVQDSLPHAAVWRSFLEKAPPEAWRAWVHCVDYKACLQRNISQELPGMQLVSSVHSERCTDLVSPQWKLVNSALKAYPKAARGATDKFVLVSGACLPIKPFSVMYKQFTDSRSDESDFCLMDPKKEWQKTIVNGIVFYLVKHSQWAVLSRRHAAHFSQRWTGLDKSGKWSFEMPAKKFSGARFYLDRKDKHNWRCADEFALFATIFGLYVPGTHGVDDCPLNKTLQCKTVDTLMTQSRCRTMYYFYKTDDSPILKEINKDHGTKLTWRGDGHPAEFMRVSAKSLQILRRAPQFFARKFHPQAELAPNYGEILFAEHGGHGHGHGRGHRH